MEDVVGADVAIDGVAAFTINLTRSFPHQSAPRLNAAVPRHRVVNDRARLWFEVRVRPWLPIRKNSLPVNLLQPGSVEGELSHFSVDGLAHVEACDVNHLFRAEAKLDKIRLSCRELTVVLRLIGPRAFDAMHPIFVCFFF